MLKSFHRARRMLVPSPAERKFVEAVGFVWLVLHGIKREYPIAGYYADFANPRTKCAVEIDGRKFHDVVSDYERDSHMQRLGWSVYRIPARLLYSQPGKVRDTARRWLR